jgi:hypothetical protein
MQSMAQLAAEMGFWIVRTCLQVTPSSQASSNNHSTNFYGLISLHRPSGSTDMTATEIHDCSGKVAIAIVGRSSHAHS